MKRLLLTVVTRLATTLIFSLTLSGCVAARAVAIANLDVMPAEFTKSGGSGGECVAWANDGSCQLRVSVIDNADSGDRVDNNSDGQEEVAQ